MPPPPPASRHRLRRSPESRARASRAGSPTTTRILILGGTTEASALARLLAGDPRWDPLLSLAGVTRAPAPAPIPRRIGGFGGADGLARHLRETGTARLVDATHPFATRITANAASAAAATGVPLLRIRRPPWDETGCVVASDMEDAARLLGAAPRRVLLTVGRLDLASFGGPHAYWVRSVDPPPSALLPQGAVAIAARGPFTLAAERALLEGFGIDTLVTKNAGGAATAAKLEAARELGCRIVMVRRPPEPMLPYVVADAHQALSWLMSPLSGT